MRELSMHIMDIAENGIGAGADFIQITIEEDRPGNQFRVKIADNGRGMTNEFLNKAIDPFITTRTTRRVGLGLSLLKEAALRCNGKFAVDSEPGRGTVVDVAFEHDHIDRAPLGDMAGSVTALIFGNTGVDFMYSHSVDGEEFSMDTRELKGSDVSFEDPDVISGLTALIRQSLDEISD